MKRIIFLILIYLYWIAVFVIEKPVFMLFNCVKQAKFIDYMEVLWHGLSLDIVTSAYLTVIPFILIILSIWIRFDIKKVIRIYCIVISVIIALIFAIDNTLYTYWNFRLDETALFYLQYPKDAMSSVTWFDIAKTTAVFVPYLALILLFYKLITKKYKVPYLVIIRHKIWQTIIFVCLMPVLFIAIRGGITTATANVGMVYYSNNQYLNHSAINPLFNLIYSLIYEENFAEEFNFFTETERQNEFNALSKYDKSTQESILTTTRPNILIIVLESFSAGFVEVLGGEKNATPNLNSLSREGVFFTNCYANSFRTDRGLVAILNAYLGQPTTSIMKYPSKSQTLPSIAKTLKAVGYDNTMLYGGDINFTNMQSYFYSSGYDVIISDKDFPLSQRASKWGVNDGTTFEYLYNNLLKRNKQRHWQTTFLTLSSHEPFDVPFKHFEDPFVNSIAYTDSCIGNFVTRLKQSDLWQNLLIIFVADHGTAFPKGTRYYEPNRFHIPMLWIGGAVKEPMIINKICNQTDLAATLLNQMKLPYNDFIFSKDVLDKNSPEYAIFTYNNGFGFVDSTGVSVFDNNSNKVLMNQDSTRIKKGKVLLQTLYNDLSKR
ncbi:MAG: sulfatase-like hydrolase/transferase [Bacteroidales bacterium]|jgi:phosphoglycerol transferase MdoB-like AlkP superfamily enzyme|nr:sulfatase-like hydrolase/transferase [Bacteroidales bacterium]